MRGIERADLGYQIGTGVTLANAIDAAKALVPLVGVIENDDIIKEETAQNDSGSGSHGETTGNLTLARLGYFGGSWTSDGDWLMYGTDYRLYGNSVVGAGVFSGTLRNEVGGATVGTFTGTYEESALTIEVVLPFHNYTVVLWYSITNKRPKK